MIRRPWRALLGLWRLFRSGRDSSIQRSLQREHASILSGVITLFAILGPVSSLFFTLDFRSRMDAPLVASCATTIALYAALVASALRWMGLRDDGPFIRKSVILFSGLGVSWGVLVNLFALHGTPDQQGELIGLIMTLVSTPMLGVPLPVALAFFAPISIFCALAIVYTLQPIHSLAVYSFFGFLVFTLFGLIYINRTILERALTRLSLQREHETVSLFLREYQEESSDWLWETDASGSLRNLSPRMMVALSKTIVEPGDISLVDLIGAADQSGSNGLCLSTLMQGRVAFRDLVLPFAADDQVRWVQLTGHPLYRETGEFYGYRGIGSDITEARRAAQQIEFLASRDGLTGLMNRKCFVEGISLACADHLVAGSSFILVMVDLDAFASVNDDLGHMVGDALLRTVGDRLQEVLRPTDLSSRIGGDEFAVLLRNVAPREAELLTSRIRNALHARLPVEGTVLHPKASMGAALFPEHGQDTEQLMRAADLALNHAKSKGKGHSCLFEPWMEVGYQKRIRLEAELLLAIEGDEIFLDYQPIFDTVTREIVSVEALVRWKHPVRGVLTPGEFVPYAESNNLIEQLGAHVLRLACVEVASWQNRLPVAVNVSPKQFRAGSFVTTVEKSLAESGLPVNQLTLEVTETVFLNASDHTIQQLNELRALGIRIVLDDFGTGYSSLAYLRSFDVDGIKIDQSFTRDLPEARKVAAIVRTISRLASEMAVYVIAEGVETEPQFKWLFDNGIAFAQGYLLSRPLGGASVVDLIRLRNGASKGRVWDQ